MEKEKFDAIMQDIEMEVQARLNEKEKTEKNTTNNIIKENKFNNKESLNKNGKKKRSILFYIVVGIIVLIILENAYYYISEWVKKVYVYNFAKDADICVFYNTDEETINEYIEDDELDKMMKEGDYPSEMFAINLDEKKIIFLEGSFSDLHVYDLIEGKIPMSVGKYTQTIFDLDGSKFDYLFAYYDKGEEYDHLTTAIYIVTEDGQEYYAETKDKDLDRDFTFLDLKAARDRFVIVKEW